MSEPQAIPTCYRHPDRRGGVTCQRCGRSICPSCMVQASVGFHCPECARAGAKASPVITARSLSVRPVATQVLIALNVAAFVATLASGSGLQSSQMSSLAVDYALIGGYGGRTPVLGVAAGQWYRLITGGFLHSGIIHLGLNMVFLWLIGSQLEKVMGSARFVAIYLASLLAGSFAVMLVSPRTLTVGASGALFGLMGAAFVMQRAQGLNPWHSGLGGLILMNLLFTLFWPGISIAGHIGGLIGGAVIAAAMSQVDRRSSSIWPGIAVAAAIGMACFVGGLWAASYWASPLLGA